uniref:Uncharacterized protein n=1 Tax=Glossina pallidipes TaxID=7398 RepID=A0A1A9ZUI3_GLOPL
MDTGVATNPLARTEEGWDTSPTSLYSVGKAEGGKGRMESGLSNVIKMILEVDETSLTDYSAPDSILTFTAKPPWQSFRRVRPNKIKYDFLDLRIKPRHGQEELITTPSYKRLKP